MNHYKAALAGWEILVNSQAFSNVVQPLLCFAMVSAVSGLIIAWALATIAEGKKGA